MEFLTFISLKRLIEELGWKYLENELLTWEDELEDAVFSWNNSKPWPLVFFRGGRKLLVQWFRGQGIDLVVRIGTKRLLGIECKNENPKFVMSRSWYNANVVAGRLDKLPKKTPKMLLISWFHPVKAGREYIETDLAERNTRIVETHSLLGSYEEAQKAVPEIYGVLKWPVSKIIRNAEKAIGIDTE